LIEEISSNTSLKNSNIYIVLKSKNLWRRIMKNKYAILCYICLAFAILPIAHADTISGYIKNASGLVLNGVTVEAWDLADNFITTSTTNALGIYNLTGLTTGTTYLIRAYQIVNLSEINTGDCSAEPLGYDGYMAKAATSTTPRTSFNFSLIRMPRKNVDYFTNGMFSTTYYGSASTFNNRLLSKGDVVLSRDPQGVLNGISVNCWDDVNSATIRGGYSLDAFADDPDTVPDEGAIAGDLMTFYINNVSATNSSGTRTWDRGAHNTELTTTGSGAVCQLMQSSWSQSNVNVDTPVTINVISQSCGNKQVNVTIYEGGNVSRGIALVQPGIITLDLFGSAAVSWIAEWKNDTGGTDANPPEYYFVVTLIENTTVKSNSSTYNAFLTINPDTTAPIISNVVATPYGDNAVITWDTDKNATSKIDYGLTTSYGSSVTDSTLVLNHFTMPLHLNLLATYYYRITSTDKYGNTATFSSSFILPSPATIVLEQGLYNYSQAQDTYIYSYVDSDLGGLTYFRVGPRLENNSFSYPVIQFNLSPLPSNVTIQSAYLNLTYALQTEGSLPMNISVYRVLKSWKTGNGTDPSILPDIGEVCWNYSRYNTNLWSVQGAEGIATDREGTAQSTRSFDSSTPLGSEVSWTLNTSTIQAWANNGTINYGFILKTPNSNNINATRYQFWSSEYGLTSSRPKLVITFTKPAVCSLTYDANCNNCINATELNAAIQAWYSDVITIPVLMQHIKQWKICSNP
jgi:hypothetical protein